MFKRGPKEPVVTLFYVTDLHGSQIAYRKFLNAAQSYGVDALICGGDVAGKQMYPIVSGRDRSQDRRNGRPGPSPGLAGGDGRGQGGDREPRRLRRRAQPGGGQRAGQGSRTGRDALFTRLVQQRLAEWIELAEERLKDSDIRVYVTGGNDDSVEMLEPLVERRLRPGDRLRGPASSRCAATRW